MPQNPIQVQQYPPASGRSSRLFINGTTVVKAVPGTVIQLNVLAAGSGTGTVNDCATTAAVATANEIAVIPETVGPLLLNFPCLVGITITPGTGQELSVSYD